MTSRILLAEDTAPIRDWIMKHLDKAGYSVTAVENGVAAFTLYQDTQRDPDIGNAVIPFDLVVTDGKMPGMPGWELIGKIRKYEVEHGGAVKGRTPVVILGISSSPEYLKDLEKAGATSTLCKPFKKQELLLAVENCLRG